MDFLMNFLLGLLIGLILLHLERRAHNITKEELDYERKKVKMWRDRYTDLMKRI